MSGGRSSSALPELGDAEFEELLSAAQAGEATGFDGLVRAMGRRLVAFAKARGAADPEGTANETLVQMCQSIGSFSGNQVQFRAWVYTIARNRIIDEHRRAQRRVDATPVPDSDLDRTVDDKAESSALEQNERVEQLLQTLTEEQREVLILRVLGGLSVEETALVVDRRPGAVRALQHRALRRLRADLSPELTPSP